MTSNDRLEQIISNVQLLSDLVKSMINSEMYPVSFFSQGFDLIQKIQSDFHTLEADQVEMFAEQLKKHQALILSIHQQMRIFSTQTQVLIPPVIDPTPPSDVAEKATPPRMPPVTPPVAPPAEGELKASAPSIAENKKKTSLLNRLGLTSSPSTVSEQNPVPSEKPVKDIPPDPPASPEEKIPPLPPVPSEAPVTRPVRPVQPPIPPLKGAGGCVADISDIPPIPSEAPVTRPVRPVQPPPIPPLKGAGGCIADISDISEAPVTRPVRPVQPPPPPSGIPSFLVSVGETSPAENQQSTLNDVIEKKKMSDLRKAFSLNDRFRYRKELFGGSEEAMNKAITILNSRQSFKECVQFLEEKLHWDFSDPTVKDFVKALELRFL